FFDPGFSCLRRSSDLARTLISQPTTGAVSTLLAPPSLRHCRSHRLSPDTGWQYYGVEPWPRTTPTAPSAEQSRLSGPPAAHCGAPAVPPCSARSSSARSEERRVGAGWGGRDGARPAQSATVT